MKLLESIRLALGIRGRLHEQKGTLQSVNQGLGSYSCAAQIGDNLGFANNAPFVIQGGASCYQRNVNNSDQMAKVRSDLKENNRSPVGNYWQVRIAEQDSRSHPNSPLLIDRLSRACRAFVNAWRVA